MQGKTIVTDTGRIVKTPEGKITHYEKKDQYEDMHDFREWIHGEYLVIETYQNDKFVFFKDIEARTGIDIYEKFEELDSYFL